MSRPTRNFPCFPYFVDFQFSDVAGTVYPEDYEAFLSKLDFINADVGRILSHSCVAEVNFYVRLLLSTLGPLVVLTTLGVTFYVARLRIDTAEQSIRRVYKDHISTAMFVLFFIYSSTSFTIFQTFVCDELDDRNAYLRADYSLKCFTRQYYFYRTYASVMVAIYPIGVPALFLWWLARSRVDLNKPDRTTLAHLQPFSGLWATYRPSCYYYEVVECSRRISLTAAAAFVMPGTSTQTAVVLLVAVVFVFASESISPFQDKYDMWLYRWGNGIILSSMYVALLVKVELTEDGSHHSSAFAVLLILANVFMIATVVVQALILVKGRCSSQNS